MKYLVHIDINQFFAACEIIKDPTLESKPLIISSNGRRSIVSTASYEARKYGVYSSQPTYQALLCCPKAVVKNPDYHFYQQKSNELFTYLKKTYTLELEQVSIDEAYLDMTSILENVEDKYAYLKRMQIDVFKVTKLKTSIGLGPNRFLAKMGSDYRKPMGITIIFKEDVPKLLYPLKISSFWGIGKKTYPKLNDIGIYTIGDLATSTSPKIKEILGKFYFEMIQWLDGRGDDEVHNERRDPKSISSSTTFPYDTSDYEEIRLMLSKKSKEVALQAKNEQMRGRVVTLIIKEADFKSITRSKKIVFETDDSEVIYQEVMDLFEQYFNGQLIRLAGVGLGQLTKTKEILRQGTLLDSEKSVTRTSPQLLVKQLNHHLNKELFTIASNLKKKNEN